MSGQSRPVVLSLVRRLTGVFQIIMRYSLIFGGLIVLTGFCYGLTDPKQMELMISQQVEKIIIPNTRELPDFTGCISEPEEEMTTTEFIRSTGYPAEEHYVTTDDGYILALHRIPGAQGSPAVLLHHAVLESSFCWVVSGAKQGLAYYLANHGYDVWMANSRGNTYSRNHTTLLPSDPNFWNFSWHEMGIYDLPAEIEYITKLRNDDSLFYVGHSMGTTMFYVMASERPDIASKVKAMFALAPVTFTDRIRGPFWFFGTMFRQIQKLVGNFDGMSEFPPQNSVIKFVGKCICNRPIIKNICHTIISSTSGFNNVEFNTTWISLLLSHTPAGTSLKTLLHFAQGIESKRFMHYDYGVKRNLLIYNSEEPTEYDFSKIQVPIAIFWGQNDFLARPKNVMRLYGRLPRKIGMYRMDDPNFNHLDFIYGVEAPKVLYSKIVELMKKYQSSNDTLS